MLQTNLRRRLAIFSTMRLSSESFYLESLTMHTRTHMYANFKYQFLVCIIQFRWSACYRCELPDLRRSLCYGCRLMCKDLVGPPPPTFCRISYSRETFFRRTPVSCLLPSSQTLCKWKTGEWNEIHESAILCPSCCRPFCVQLFFPHFAWKKCSAHDLFACITMLPADVCAAF